MSIAGRYHTLKNLIKMSTDAISRYGFRYFISTAILEIKNNGFQIFAAQRETKIPRYSINDAYKIWKENAKITKEKENQIKNEVDGFLLKPRITVVVYAGNEINPTLESLRAQIYQNFHVILVCKPEALSTIKAKTEKLRDIDLSFEEFSNSKKFDENSDMIVFLTRSNVLSSDSLFHIVKSLNEEPDIDMIYSDEDEIDENEGRINPFFKPDWSYDLFLSQDYITSFYAIKNDILKEVGGIRGDFNDVMHYDLVLRATDKKRKIHRIAKVLSSIKKQETSKDYTSLAKKSLEETLVRRNLKGAVLDGLVPNTFRIKYALNGTPKVSIIIPTRDQKEILKRCLTGIEKSTSYRNFEIIIVDNGSKEKNTIDYLNSLKYSVIKYQDPFNFSKMNNLAAKQATGDYLLFLNDDTLPLKEDWLENMLELCQQKDIGVVGAKLVLSDNTIQHAGWVYLNTGAGLHPFSRVASNSQAFNGQINVIRNYSAVTAACLLIKKKIFDEIGGFDDDFDLYYGDPDLCFRVIEKGYRIVYTPYALLLHEGSKSIKKHAKAFFSAENHAHFVEKWPHTKNGDPFYNPNLRLDYRISDDS